VKVTDSVDNIVPSANVTATYPNATIAGSQLTDAGGNVWFALEEKKVNASGNYPVGDYVLNAAYGAYHANTTINLTGNQQTIMKLEGFVIPEYQSFFILLVFVTTTLLAVIVCKRRRTVHLQMHKRF
jgi:hypothetical protein